MPVIPGIMVVVSIPTIIVSAAVIVAVIILLSMVVVVVSITVVSSVVILVIVIVVVVVVSVTGWNIQDLPRVNIVGVVQAICSGNGVGAYAITPPNSGQGFSIANPVINPTTGRRSRLTIGNVDGLQQNNSQNNWEYFL